MDCLVIKGGTALKGEVKISGAKNAALPLMAATLLTDEECVLRNLPNLSDVRFMTRILKSLGATVETGRGSIKVRAKKIEGFGDYDLIVKIEASNMGEIARHVVESIRAIPGVANTKTLACAEM